MATLMDQVRKITAGAQAFKESLQPVTTPKQAREALSAESGYGRVRTSNNPAYLRRVHEAAKLVRDVLTGQLPEYYLREAMTISDFPNLMGDVMYRQLLGNYQAAPTSYQQWTEPRTLKDFRSLHMLALDGGQALLDKVAELAQYPETSFTETAYTVAVAKYGRRYGISFESLINDDLEAFSQRPQLMAQSVAFTQEYLATQMLCDATGPHPTFFTAGHKNIVTGNPALSIQALQLAYQVLAAQKGADGQPIIVTGVELVVPPALEVTAENIMNALQLRINSTGGVANGGGNIDQFLYTVNWMAKRCRLNLNYTLPLIDTTSGNTAWYLIAKTAQAGRPAFVFAKLRGHENPELWVKSPDAQMIGGGTSDPTEGSFDIDGIDYKLRTFMGAAQIDPKMAVSSTGVN